MKPPYGRITALDLNRGELKWMVANGDGPRIHPALKALNLPPLGQPVRAAPLVTKTLLFVTEGDQINVRTPPNGGGKKIPRLRQGDRAGAVGDGARSREHRHADDLPAQGQAIHRRRDRRHSASRRVRRLQPAVTIHVARDARRLADHRCDARRAAAASRNAGDWISYGGTNWSQKYSPLDQITRDNFNTLTMAWTWTSPDFEIVKRDRHDDQSAAVGDRTERHAARRQWDDVLSTGLGQIAAIDPASGATKWLYDPESYKDGGSASVVGPWQTRGVAYWSDGRNDRRVLMGTSDGYLIAVNADSGKPIESFGVNGKADLYPAIPRAKRNAVKLWSGESQYVSPNSPPVIVRDTVIVGAAMSDRPPKKDWPPGHVQAFDARSGKLKWVFHVIPEDGEFGADTWKDGSNHYTGNANVWTMMSGDDELGHVYLPIYDADERLLGRVPQRRQPLCRQPRRRERRDRQARLAFPDRAPRRLGLRLAGRADAARPHGRGTSHQGDRADEQAGFHLRLRSRQRHAAVADRRAPGSAVGYSGRGALADATVSRPGRRRSNTRA